MARSPKRQESAVRLGSWRGFLWAYEREKGDPVSKVPEVWIEQPLEGGWVAAFRLYEQRGTIGVAELRVFPNEPDRDWPGRWSAEEKRLGLTAPVPGDGLTARTVRRIRFDDVVATTHEAIEKVRGELGEDLPPQLRHFRIFEPETSVRRGRGLAWTEERYARLAASYVNLIESGSSAPVLELAREEHYSEGAIRKALTRARALGLLTATSRRRAGGRLTPKAIALLEADDG